MMRLVSKHLVIEPMSRAGISAARQELPEDLLPLCSACADALAASESAMLWYTGWLIHTSDKKTKIVGILSLNGPPDEAHTVELKGAFRSDLENNYAEEAIRCFLKKWLWQQEDAVYLHTSPAQLAGAEAEALRRMGFTSEAETDIWECERPVESFTRTFAMLGCLAGVYVSTHFDISVLAAFAGTAVGYAAGLPLEKRECARHRK